MKYMVSLGGDTDTNAAIVGGLVGASFGLKKLNKDLVMKLLDFRCQSRKDQQQYGVRHVRPAFLVPGEDLLPKALKLFKHAPAELKVKV